MNQDRKRILEMVQEGKLSAQEAIVLLDALEASPKRDTSSDGYESNRDKETHMPSQLPVPGGSAGRSEGKEKSGAGDEDSFFSQMENAGDRLVDFVNSTFKKIKDMDWQFTQTVEVDHAFQQEGKDVERIDIDIANGPVRIIGWDQEGFRVECHAKIYRLEDKEEGRSYFLDNTLFTQEDGMLCFATKSKWMRVEATVYVPKRDYRKVAARLFFGEATVERVNAAQLLLKTTNGKVDVSDFSGERLEVDTMNGQVRLMKVNADSVEAETVNGAIDLTGNCRKTDLKSFNGNINCSLSESGAEMLHAKAVTGNIGIQMPKGMGLSGEIRSNLGNYQLDLEGIDIVHEKKDVVQKQLTFRRPGNGEGKLYVSADTKTGSVTMKEVTKEG